MAAKQRVIGNRSQNNVWSFGSRWYQDEPKPVRKIPPNNTKVVASRRNRARPMAPTAMKGRLETTFQKFGMPNNSRWSAN
jgi:hypothetical protein